MRKGQLAAEEGPIAQRAVQSGHSLCQAQLLFDRQLSNITHMHILNQHQWPMVYKQVCEV